MSGFDLTGSRELIEALAALNPKHQKAAVRGALRDAGRPIIRAARRHIRNRSRELSRSLKVQPVMNDGQPYAYIGSIGKKAWYARLVEEGTKAHAIPGATVGRGRNKRANKARVVIHNKVYSKASHPGATARPFMGPAIDAEAKAAFEVLTKRLRERIVLEAAKQGL